VCPECLEDATEWRAASGRGRVWSYAVYERALHPAFDVPYVVAAIELDEGPIFISNLVGRQDYAIGETVEAIFENVTPEVTLVKFRGIDNT
jgi:uncharacterized OB-fold protein